MSSAACPVERAKALPCVCGPDNSTLPGTHRQFTEFLGTFSHLFRTCRRRSSHPRRVCRNRRSVMTSWSRRGVGMLRAFVLGLLVGGAAVTAVAQANRIPGNNG